MPPPAVRTIFRISLDTQQGTWPFRSALSQQYPLKPYRLSDDVESFVHIFNYLLLRFMKQARRENLSLFVHLLYEEEDIVVDRAGRRLHTGGNEKMEYILTGRTVLKPLNNPTITSLLAELADLCREHYASVDMAAMKKSYGLPTPLSAPPPKSRAGTNTSAMSRPKRRPGTQGSTTALTRQASSSVPVRAHRTGVSPSTPSPLLSDHLSTSVVGTGAPEVSPVPPPHTTHRPLLDTHKALIGLFRKFHSDDSLWIEEYTWKKDPEDLFKKENLATHKDNAFSGVESRYINTTMEVRVTKKRKGNDMQSIGETFSEEPGF